MPYYIQYTVNKDTPELEFKSEDGPYPDVRSANERKKELERIPHISDVHRTKASRLMESQR